MDTIKVQPTEKLVQLLPRYTKAGPFDVLQEHDGTEYFQAFAAVLWGGSIIGNNFPDDGPYSPYLPEMAKPSAGKKT